MTPTEKQALRELATDACNQLWHVAPQAGELLERLARLAIALQPAEAEPRQPVPPNEQAPEGFAFCAGPHAHDSHDSAIAWHPRIGYGEQNCLMELVPPWRWIRPAGVPVSELWLFINAHQSTLGTPEIEGLTALCRKYEGKGG